MFIASFKKPGTEEVYLLHWDLSKNKPAEGAVLLSPPDFKIWVNENHKETAPKLDEYLANVADHGTSHSHKMVTPERWLSRSNYKPNSNKPARHYTVEDLFNLYYEEPEALGGQDALKKSGDPEKEEKKEEEEEPEKKKGSKKNSSK